jgi:hypothetical protein
MTWFFALADANASINANFIIGGFYIFSGCYSASNQVNGKIRCQNQFRDQVNGTIHNKNKAYTDPWKHYLGGGGGVFQSNVYKKWYVGYSEHLL